MASRGDATTTEQKYRKLLMTKQEYWYSNITMLVKYWQTKTYLATVLSFVVERRDDDDDGSSRVEYYYREDDEYIAENDLLLALLVGRDGYWYYGRLYMYYR